MIFTLRPIMPTYSVWYPLAETCGLNLACVSSCTVEAMRRAAWAYINVSPAKATAATALPTCAIAASISLKRWNIRIKTTTMMKSATNTHGRHRLSAIRSLMSRDAFIYVPVILLDNVLVNIFGDYRDRYVIVC